MTEPVALERIDAVTLVTADMARSVAFYTALGFPVRFGGESAPFTTYSVGSSWLNVQAGDGAYIWILQRRHETAQIAGLDANIAVADHQVLVRGFFGQAGELGALVVGGLAPGADDGADVDSGEISGNALDDGQRRIGSITDTEKNFVLRIVEAAEAGEVFVSLGVEAAYRFEDADRRQKLACIAEVGLAARKKTRRAENRKGVVDERNGCNAEERNAQGRNGQ